MIGQDNWSIDWIQSKIQSRIATFLSLKEKLIKIKSTSLDLNVKTKAESLLETQKSLEDELSDILKIIERVKLGSYSISDMISLGSFYYRIESHISDVNELEKLYAQSPKETEGLSTPILLSLIAGGVLLLLLRK